VNRNYKNIGLIVNINNFTKSTGFIIPRVIESGAVKLNTGFCIWKNLWLKGINRER
jgi:hypothetical protein